MSMNKILVIELDSKLIGGFITLNKLLGYKGVTEYVIFLNGLESDKFPELVKASKLSKVTLMETEVEIPKDRVYRQVFSYVHQTQSSGMLYFIKGSDSLGDLSISELHESPGLVINDNAVPNNFNRSKFDKVYDLFELRYEFGFNLIVDIADLKHILTSEDLYEFFSKFITYPVIRHIGIKGNVADLLGMHQTYWKSLIKSDEFEHPINKIIKQLIA